ncbi:tRNA 2'-phosphotransferase 1-like [Uloborus diversus]|uniref:tRNA 2'-phosphotransferase 1-like n=1 Tax=Uloborus diversus TaxID=327109 RepID=UPI00240923EC|nr:tRNA 2'-phosphotransferase 1-like [Uloborus diversus]
MHQQKEFDGVKLSKLLSWLLRHGANKEGLSLDGAGYIEIEKILSLKQFQNYTSDDILRVVDINDKQRFSIRKNIETGLLQIRANQGHSLSVDDKELLTLLDEHTVPELVYHGTYFRSLNSIKENGLSKMKRNHIHFTSKYPTNSSIISGMRKNCEIFIVVAAKKAFADGYKFFKSENDVILCPGNKSGVIAPSYFKEIWQLSPLKKIG